MSKLSEKLMGSKPTEPIRPSVLEGLVRKGTALENSALRAVDDCVFILLFVVIQKKRRGEEELCE